MLEIEVPPAPAIRRAYRHGESLLLESGHEGDGTLHQHESRASFSLRLRPLRKNEDKPVMVDAVALVANEKQQRATALRDQGRIEDARQTLKTNAEFFAAKCKITEHATRTRKS